MCSAFWRSMLASARALVRERRSVICRLVMRQIRQYYRARGARSECGAMAAVIAALSLQLECRLRLSASSALVAGCGRVTAPFFNPYNRLLDVSEPGFEAIRQSRGRSVWSAPAGLVLCCRPLSSSRRRDPLHDAHDRISRNFELYHDSRPSGDHPGADREGTEGLRSGREHIVHHHRCVRITALDVSNPPAGLQGQHAALDRHRD